MKLSPAQKLVLAWLYQYGPCAWGFAPIRTLRVLQDYGLIVWCPYATGVLGKRNEGAWKLLSSGRAMVDGFRAEEIGSKSGS